MGFATCCFHFGFVCLLLLVVVSFFFLLLVCVCLLGLFFSLVCFVSIRSMVVLKGCVLQCFGKGYECVCVYIYHLSYSSYRCHDSHTHSHTQ